MDSQREQTDPTPPRPVFRRRHRLAGERDFGAVFGAKARKSRGPITVFVRPNGLPEHRLGLSVGRRMGNAVVRGRFKRMMREVFRHHRATLASPSPDGSGSYDIVVTTRAHEALTLAQYAACFVEAFEAAHRVHAKRASR